MSLSPYEANILDFVQIAEKQPELLTDEDRASLADLLTTLPDNIEQISDKLALWYETRPHILNAILELPPSDTGERGPGGRKTRLSAEEAKKLLENIVRQSTSPNPRKIPLTTHEPDRSDSGTT